MVEHPEKTIQEFAEAASRAGLDCGLATITHEAQPAPHLQPSLPANKCAVYVFSLSASHGQNCPAGVHRALKVGKAGPNSRARFQYQHYNPRSSRSNLAASLVGTPILWPYLGVQTLADSLVGRWIRENVDRDNFYLDFADSGLLMQLERYIRARLGPVFEGD